MLEWAICIGLFVLGLVLVALIWRRAPLRASIWWLGLALLPLGALLSGMVPTLIDVWNSLALWFQRVMVQPIANTILAGLVVLGLGLLLMLVSRVIPYRKRDRRSATARTGTTTTTVSRNKPVYDSTTGSGSSDLHVN